jgi:hypothetical protein
MDKVQNLKSNTAPLSKTFRDEPSNVCCTDLSYSRPFALEQEAVLPSDCH